MARTFVFILTAALIGTTGISHGGYAADGNGAITVPQAIAATTPQTSMLLGPVTISGPWLEFGFGAVGTFATGCIPADPIGITSCFPSPGGNSAALGTPPWTFTALKWVQLTVTDAGAPGDQFEVFDNNTSIGSSSAVPVTGGRPGCNDPGACLVDTRYSHGVFTLPPGSHSLTVKMLISPFFPALGAAFFRIDQVSFSGTPGASNCKGISVTALAQQFGDLDTAARSLGYTDVGALQAAVSAFCTPPPQ